LQEYKITVPVWGEDTSEGRASTKTLELTNGVEGSNGRDGRGDGDEGKRDNLDHFQRYGMTVVEGRVGRSARGCFE